MATQALMPVEDYLRKHFEREPEYRDGILEERAMPDAVHGLYQMLLGVFLGSEILAGRLAVISETRMRLRANRYVLPDVAIVLGRLTERVPSTAPLAVIEILSPSEAMSGVLVKLREYREWGVQNVWLIDPAQRVIQVFDGHALATTDEFRLPEHGVAISAAQLFAAADRLSPKG